MVMTLMQKMKIRLKACRVRCRVRRKGSVSSNSKNSLNIWLKENIQYLILQNYSVYMQAPEAPKVSDDYSRRT